jgi:hypothetical protein
VAPGMTLKTHVAPEAISNKTLNNINGIFFISLKTVFCHCQLPLPYGPTLQGLHHRRVCHFTTTSTDPRISRDEEPAESLYVPGESTRSSVSHQTMTDPGKLRITWTFRPAQNF